MNLKFVLLILIHCLNAVAEPPKLLSNRIVAGIPACSMCEDDPDFSTSRIQIKTNNGDQEVSVIDKDRAQKLFDQIKKMPLGYQCTNEGCMARAHKIAQFLDQQHIQSAKAVVTTKSQSVNLRPQGIAEDRGWNFHVAPVIYIRKGGGKLVPYIIDPALFPDGPVDMNTWLERSRGRTAAADTEHFLATKFTYSGGAGRRPSPTSYDPDDIESANEQIQTCHQESRPAPAAYRSNPSEILH